MAQFSLLSSCHVVFIFSPWHYSLLVKKKECRHNPDRPHSPESPGADRFWAIKTPNTAFIQVFMFLIEKNGTPTRKVQPRQPPFFCELLISCYWFKQFSPHYQNKCIAANRDWIKETAQLRSQNAFVCIMSKRNITTCFIFIFRCTQNHVLFVSLITIAHFKACLCVSVCEWGGCTEIICLNSYVCGAWTPVCWSVELGFQQKLEAVTKHLLYNLLPVCSSTLCFRKSSRSKRNVQPTPGGFWMWGN